MRVNEDELIAYLEVGFGEAVHMHRLPSWIHDIEMHPTNDRARTFYGLRSWQFHIPLILITL